MLLTTYMRPLGDILQTFDAENSIVMLMIVSFILLSVKLSFCLPVMERCRWEIKNWVKANFKKFSEDAESIIFDKAHIYELIMHINWESHTAKNAGP